MKPAATQPNPSEPRRSGLILAGLLTVMLLALFRQAFVPGNVHFANDGPLGALMAEQLSLPQPFTGIWQDLNWLGGWNGSATPTPTFMLLWLLKPVVFTKLYPAIVSLLLGLGTFLCLRSLGIRPSLSVAGAIAGSLNSGFFSYACWGLGTLTLTIMFFMLAVAAIGVNAGKGWFPRLVIAGAAIGMAVMEGFDNGAILSVYLAAYALWVFIISRDGALIKRLALGAGSVAVIAVFAGVVSSSVMTGLISTQVKGVVGMEQDKETKAKRWAEATQWSLPKVETLRLFVSGLHGYRMDTPDGGQYWGGVGRHPIWDEFLAQDSPDQKDAPYAAMLRFSGAGFYCGVLVCLLAAWAVFRSFGREGNVYSQRERLLIWFWAAMALGSLLLAWGRFAPFYAIAYELPYFSTIRNPIKFLHPLNITIVILFAYGLEGLWRTWSNQTSAGETWKLRFANWWRSSRGFDRYWIVGSVVLMGFSLFATMIYGSMKDEMTRLLVLIGPVDAATATSIFRFSVKEIFWSLLFFATSLALIGLLMSGTLRRQKSGILALVIVIALTGIDLMRANAPWVQFYNYQERYASTPLYDLLGNKPWEHRVQMMPGILRGGLGGLAGSQFKALQTEVEKQRLQPQQLQQLGNMMLTLGKAYGAEWLQYQFQFFNIHSLDVVQEPRVAIENQMFRDHFPLGDPAAELRMARLTNCRYFIGLGEPVLEPLNQFAASEGGPFKEVMSIWMAQNGDYVQPAQNTNMPFALIEYTGALPRASLYANWQIESDATNILQTLASREFDPGKTVIVEGDCPAPTNPDADAGTVTITDYHPKEIHMKADAKVASVLLFNDKHDPHWNVWVDGQPATLLKANFLMRGLHLEPGEHEIVWKFQPPAFGLYLSLAGIAVALTFTRLVVVRPGKEAPAEKK